VPELALDHDQRDAFVCHLDGVRVAALVRREPAPDARRSSSVLQLLAGCGRLPMPPAGRAVDDAEQRSGRQTRPELKPRVELVPGPPVHPNLAPLPALAAAHEHRAPRAVEIGLSKRKRFSDPESGAPEQHDQRPETQSVRLLTGNAHDCNVSSIVGGSAG
jgi:hypothetical protein